MGKLLKDNLGNILVIFVISVLVFGLSYYFFKSKPIKANIGQIKILPTGYTIYFEGLSSDEPGWHNPGAALIQDLGPEAGFKEFNEENSAFSLEKRGTTQISTQNNAEIPEEVIIPNEEIEEGLVSPSEESILSPSELFEEIPVSPSESSFNPEGSLLQSAGLQPGAFGERSYGASRRAPFVLSSLVNFFRIFEKQILFASESENTSISEQDVGHPTSHIEEKGVSTESEEGEAIYVPLVPLDELEEMVSEAEQIATESVEVVATESEEIVTESEPSSASEEATEGEEPVIDFAPGFVERPLEFFDFALPEEFSQENSSAKEIKNVQLRLSMAFEGGGPQDSLIIEYNVGGFASYMDWQLLAELYLSDPNSNKTNNGYWLYGLPSQILRSKTLEGEPISWEYLENLKIRFRYRGFLPDPMAPMGLENQPKGKVYLDAVWLEVEYEEISDIKEKEKRISEEKIISEKSFDEFNVLKVEKENKKFELKFTLNNDFGESSLNFIADDSIIDLQSPIGSKFNYIFWLDKDKKGLYSFNIGTQAYNSISNNPGENNCLTFLDPASEKWQACYDETLNDFVFEPIIEIIAISETSSEILPESETLLEVQSEVPLETSSPENLIENLIKDVENLIKENLPKDLF